ncbi:MAG: hypothetical protein LDLANPLL_01397 [Turneriella sp.]|nr:hypothetical protein [Turneriella sp.]
MKALSLTVFFAFVFSACNNYGLVDSLENPGAIRDIPPPVKRIFVSTTPSNGNMSNFTCNGGGIQNANCLCQQTAEQQGFGGTYIAFLSDDVADMSCRLFSITTSTACSLMSDAVWYNTKNEIVASGTSQLFSTAHTSAIYDKSGNAPSGSVWTGTTAGGALATSHCNRWTSNSSGVQGQTGIPSDTTGSWTQGGAAGCNTNQNFYCIAVVE